MTKKTDKRLKKILKEIKAWDKRNTTFPSWLYMAIFLTASLVFFDTLMTFAATARTI